MQQAQNYLQELAAAKSKSTKKIGQNQLWRTYGHSPEDPISTNIFLNSIPSYSTGTLSSPNTSLKSLFFKIVLF
jgi:hypothetical protein